ncbi:DMT family transporter [Aliarcobacter cibarius]|jgi:drug/metabolite transporter (DMT)-like permease|uniref:DMT family transporter n=3 Tax=Aliarcobacter cibarius TaxID=255507 RepID=A0ABY2V744_9BACT|nr:DMT family transporter [Aliarcobacter cibarius]TLS97604.1 DMT family transporter [Aliarcobacter cibarius]TLS98119.1 DMT family transporter [Aliarcobacter cibarius]
MSKELNSHLIIILATFLVGGSFVISQKLSGIIDPISITLLRFVIASLVLVPIIFLNQNYRKKLIPTFNRAMIISFFYSLFFIGLFKALEYTTALNTGTIFTLVPFITAVFSIFIFNQKISLMSYLVYFIGIIGTSMVVFRGNLELFISLSLNNGDIIFLLAIFSMALYSICMKYFHKEDDELIVLVFMTLFGGVIWMSLSLIIFDIPLNWTKIGTEEFLYIIYLSILATLVTSYLYQRGTIFLGPKKVMAYIYLNPTAIVIISFLSGLEKINLFMLLGILISALATFILLYKNKNI